MTTSYSPLWSCTGRDGCQSALWDCFGGQICRHVENSPLKQSHNALDNHLDPVFRKTSKWPIYMLHYSHYFCYLIFLTLRYPTSYSGYRNLCKTDTWFLSLGVLLRTFDHFMTKWPLEDLTTKSTKHICMYWYSVILLKVSPETHQVKNESMSRTNESQLTSPRLKILWAFM